MTVLYTKFFSTKPYEANQRQFTYTMPYVKPYVAVARNLESQTTVRPQQPLTIHVLTPNGRTHLFSMDGNATVDDLKLKMFEADGSFADMQRMIFGGTQIEDGHMLKDYGIVSGSTVRLVLGLTGC